MRKMKRRTLTLDGCVLDSVTEEGGLMVLDFRVTDFAAMVEKHAIIKVRPSYIYGFAREIGKALERRAINARADIDRVASGFHHGQEQAKS